MAQPDKYQNRSWSRKSTAPHRIHIDDWGYRHQNRREDWSRRWNYHRWNHWRNNDS